MGKKENVLSWFLQSGPRMNKTQPGNEVMAASVFVWEGTIMQE